MTPETLKRLPDEELGQLIEMAQSELKERTEKRRQDAMDEIRRIAAAAQIQVRFSGPRKSARNHKAALKAGERYQHPSDPTKVYVVGKGRPPEWFETLRAHGALRAAVMTK